MQRRTVLVCRSIRITQTPSSFKSSLLLSTSNIQTMNLIMRSCKASLTNLRALKTTLSFCFNFSMVYICCYIFRFLISFFVRGFLNDKIVSKITSIEFIR